MKFCRYFLNYCVLHYLLLTKLKDTNSNEFRKYSNFNLTRFSFYPLLLSFSIWAVAVHWILYFYKREFNFPEVFNTTTFCGSIVLFLFSFSQWIYAIHKESAYLGEHTRKNQAKFKPEFTVFIISKSLLFFLLFFICLFINNPKPYTWSYNIQIVNKFLFFLWL